MRNVRKIFCVLMIICVCGAAAVAFAAEASPEESQSPGCVGRIFGAIWAMIYYPVYFVWLCIYWLAMGIYYAGYYLIQGIWFCVYWLAIGIWRLLLGIWFCVYWIAIGIWNVIYYAGLGIYYAVYYLIQWIWRLLSGIWFCIVWLFKNFYWLLEKILELGKKSWDWFESKIFSTFGYVIGFAILAVIGYFVSRLLKPVRDHAEEAYNTYAKDFVDNTQDYVKDKWEQI